RTDHAEREQCPAVVGSRRRTWVDRVGDDARVDPQLAKGLAPALGVHDNPIEALEQPLPEVVSRRGAARQKVVRGEDGRGAEPEWRSHVLIRSWNLFHGNSVPPQREAFLDEMLRLVTADDPDVLCVQEVPAWELGRFTAGDVAARPAIGPLPIPAELGRRLTE